MQVVGMPLRTHWRLKSHSEIWVSALPASYSVRFLPSLDQDLPRIGARELSMVESSVREGYAHIAIVPTKDWTAVNKEFRLDCRVIRLDLRWDFKSLSWDEFQGALETVLEFEERWCNTVRPRDVNSALLLPPPSFELASELSDIWTKCDCYRDIREITVANNLLQGMSSRHRRSRGGVGPFWMDEAKRIFIVDRGGHARTPDERAGSPRYRFCFELPPGFHYDVTHEARGRFSLTGKDLLYTSIRRANVDPWGLVRNVER